MTYGRRLYHATSGTVSDAVASHLAELVRGNCNIARRRPPHPALRATFSPRKGRRNRRSNTYRSFNVASPISASTTEMIQKRTTTVDSFQPFCS
jgi:hypothetical protein